MGAGEGVGEGGRGRSAAASGRPPGRGGARPAAAPAPAPRGGGNRAPHRGFAGMKGSGLGAASTSPVSPRIAMKRAPADSRGREGNGHPRTTPTKGVGTPKASRLRGPPLSRRTPGAEGRWPPPRPGYLQPLGVAGDVPRDAAQRQPVTVHGAPRAGALRRAGLRRHLARHRQQQPQGQGELPPAAHHHRPLPPGRGPPASAPGREARGAPPSSSPRGALGQLSGCGDKRSPS